MDCFPGQLTISFRCLARGQKCEFGVGKRLFHDLFQCQLIVDKEERAISWVNSVLHTMVSKMYLAVFGHMFQYGSNSRFSII